MPPAAPAGMVVSLSESQQWTPSRSSKQVSSRSSGQSTEMPNTAIPPNWLIAIRQQLLPVILDGWQSVDNFVYEERVLLDVKDKIAWMPDFPIAECVDGVSVVLDFIHPKI